MWSSGLLSLVEVRVSASGPEPERGISNNRGGGGGRRPRRSRWCVFIVTSFDFSAVLNRTACGGYRVDSRMSCRRENKNPVTSSYGYTMIRCYIGSSHTATNRSAQRGMACHMLQARALGDMGVLCFASRTLRTHSRPGLGHVVLPGWLTLAHHAMRTAVGADSDMRPRGCGRTGGGR